MIAGEHAVLVDFGVAQAVEEAIDNSPARATSSVRPSTWRPSSSSRRPTSTGAPTSTRSASSSSKCSRADSPTKITSDGPASQSRKPRTPRSLAGLRAEVPRELSDLVEQGVGTRAGGTPRQRHRTPRRPRSRAHAAETAIQSTTLGVLALVAAAIAFAVLLWRGGSRPAVDDDRVAIAPFEVMQGENTLWREGFVDLLSSNLDGAGPLRTVPPSVVMRSWDGHADVESAVAFGKRTGARFVVLGHVLEAGRDSARVTAWLVDVVTRRRAEPIELRDATERMDRIADSLTLALLRDIGDVRPVGAVRRASMGSASLPAIRAFLRGEQYLRRTEWDSALAAYARAIALDSNFALAQSHIGLTYAWLRFGTDSLAREHALRAASLNVGLGSRDSMLIVADSLRSVAYAYGGDPQYHAHVVAPLRHAAKGDQSLRAGRRNLVSTGRRVLPLRYRAGPQRPRGGDPPDLRSLDLPRFGVRPSVHPSRGAGVLHRRFGARAPLCASVLRPAPQRRQCSGNAAGGAVDGRRERRYARGTPDGRHGIRRPALSGVCGGPAGPRSARCRPRVVAGNVTHAPRPLPAARRSRVRASPARAPALVPRQVRRGVGAAGDTTERRARRDGARESERRAGGTTRCSPNGCGPTHARPCSDRHSSPAAGAWWAQRRDTMSLREMARRASVAAPRNRADALIAAYSAAVASAYLALARGDTVRIAPAVRGSCPTRCVSCAPCRDWFMRDCWPRPDTRARPPRFSPIDRRCSPPRSTCSGRSSARGSPNDSAIRRRRAESYAVVVGRGGMRTPISRRSSMKRAPR